MNKFAVSWLLITKFVDQLMLHLITPFSVSKTVQLRFDSKAGGCD